MTKLEKEQHGRLWDALTGMEISASQSLSSKLACFENPLRLCHEAGVMAPTLSSRRNHEQRFKLGSLFLKRTLNDLRAVWLLLLKGYTSQAGSVAASLYENALVTVVITCSETIPAELFSDTDNELQWSTRDLSKKAASVWLGEEKGNGSKSEYEKTWRFLYSRYKWLCQIKHPTLKSAVHDSASTSVDPDGYVVMAAPDVREEDLPVKATIATLAFGRTHDAISAFVRALNPDPHDERYKSYKRRMSESSTEASRAAKSTIKGNLPFTIHGSKFERATRAVLSKK